MQCSVPSDTADLLLMSKYAGENLVKWKNAACMLSDFGMCFKNLELHELLAIVKYFLFAVLVALYEEPEKPDSALEYPFSLL